MLPPPPPNKRQKGKSFLDKYEWTPGLQFDKKFPIDKRRWYCTPTPSTSEIHFPHLEVAFRISVVNSSTAEKGAPAE